MIEVDVKNELALNDQPVDKELADDFGHSLSNSVDSTTDFKITVD